MAVSGEPSESTIMKIRGVNSINSGTAPLYILDGVAISSADFNTVNPADIESLSVLKDASSTSIYGARAANGVIVITTKRGRMADHPTINYRMQLGFSQINQQNWNIMNTEERIRYEKEIGQTAGKNYDLLSKTDINWLDAVYNNAALLQNYELSVSGATEKTNYYVSGGYYNQEGTAIGSGFERYSIRANVEQRAAKWLKIGTNTALNYQEIQRADDGVMTLVTPISAAQFMMPYWNPYRKRRLGGLHRRRQLERPGPEPAGMDGEQPADIQEIQNILVALCRSDHHRRTDRPLAVRHRLLPTRRDSAYRTPNTRPI